MELLNEKKEEVFRYDMECSDEEEAMLRKIAIRRFAKDKQAQLEYAVRSILTEFVDALNAEQLTEKLEKPKKIKKEKNGSKNNNRK